MPLSPAMNGASKLKPIEQLVQSALRTNVKDTARVADAVSKLLPEKLKAFVNETRGVPKSFTMSTPSPTPTPTHIGRGVDDVVANVRQKFDVIMADVQAEDDRPTLEGLRVSVLDAIEDARDSAPRALQSIHRDKVFAVRSILRDQSLMLRRMGRQRNNSLKPNFLELADDIDEAAAILFVTLGEALAAADQGTGETLLDISIEELRDRKEQLLRAFDRYSGLEENEYSPDKTYWPTIFKRLRSYLDTSGEDQLRPLLVRDELARHTDRMIDYAGRSAELGFRHVIAAVTASRTLLDRLGVAVDDFITYDDDKTRNAGDYQADDPRRDRQFVGALRMFVASFEFTTGRLIALAARPLSLRSWQTLGEAFEDSVAQGDRTTEARLAKRLLANLQRRPSVAARARSGAGTDTDDKDLYRIDSLIDAISQWSPGDNQPVHKVLKEQAPEEQARCEERLKAGIAALARSLDEAIAAVGQPARASKAETNCAKALADAQSVVRGLPASTIPATGRELLKVHDHLDVALDAAVTEDLLFDRVDGPLSAAMDHLDEAIDCVNQHVSSTTLIKTLA